MNKYMKLTAIAALLVAMAAFATFTFAQGPTNPNAPPDADQMQGQAGGRHGSQMADRGVNTPMNLMAVDEADIHAAIADALGMSVAEFETAVSDGQTPELLAAELGIDFADVQAAMSSVHADALQQAVDDGLVSQEQADRMASRTGGQMGGMTSGASGQMQGQNAGGMGQGGHGNSGTHGNDGDCVNTTP